MSTSLLHQANGNNDNTSIRILLNGGDNMLGRAVQLSFPVQAPGEEGIRDSCPASHYLDMCLEHPSGHATTDLSLEGIRKLNERGAYLWGDYKVRTDNGKRNSWKILSAMREKTHLFSSLDLENISSTRSSHPQL